VDRCVLLASPGDATATAIVLLRVQAVAADAGAAAVLLEMRGAAAAAGLRSWEVRRRVLADQRAEAAALYTQVEAPRTHPGCSHVFPGCSPISPRCRAAWLWIRARGARPASQATARSAGERSRGVTDSGPAAAFP
jgi:hypothetical protein